jgi:hypothetical protein
VSVFGLEGLVDKHHARGLRYVRRFNGQVLGASSDHDQFLFGAERAPLAK